MQTETRLGCCAPWLHESSVCPLLSGHLSAGISSCKVEQRRGGAGRCGSHRGAGLGGAVARQGRVSSAGPCAEREALLAAAPGSPYLHRNTPHAPRWPVASARYTCSFREPEAVEARSCLCVCTHTGARSCTGAYVRAPTSNRQRTFTDLHICVRNVRVHKSAI